MPATRAQAPFLEKKSIANLVRLNQAQRYDQGGFPVQQLYMAGNNGSPSWKSSQSFLVDLERALREIGILRSRIGKADVRPRNQLGQLLISSLFQYAKDFIPPDFVARLRQPGVSGDALSNPARLRAEAESESQKIIRELTWRILRTWERHSVAMMTTPIEASITVDGNAVLVPTRIEAATKSSGHWNDPATDIPADLGFFQDFHEDKSGAPVTHILRASRLKKYLAANTALRSFVDNNANRKFPITGLPLDMLDDAMQRAVEIVHRQFYFTESAPNSNLFTTKNYYWPEFTMVMLSLQNPEDVIDMATTPTALDEYAGGIFVNRWMKPETKTEWVGVGANAVPYNMDGTSITVFDLTGP